MTPVGRPSVWKQHAPEMTRLYTEEGLSRGQIARRYGTSVQTVTRMLNEFDVPLEGRVGARGEISAEQRAQINAKISEARKGKGTGRCRQREERLCEECGSSYEAQTSTQQFCNRSCRNAHQGRVGKEQAIERYSLHPRLCPCGEKIPFEFRHTNQYCSLECRKKYQAKRKADPANHVTFTCQNCGNEVTRPRSWGKGYFKYCSNACAQKHTKVKQHIVVEDAVVLDSPWEALFWGLCALRKVPIERFDRKYGVEWCAGGWYAPDFWLPRILTAVEIKGMEDPEDHLKWKVFSAANRLVVLGRDELEQICQDPKSSFIFCSPPDV